MDGKPLPSEPKLAAICLNVPDDRPFHPPNPRECKLSTSNLNEIVPVESNRELFASSAVSVFPVVDAARLVDHQRKEFRQYFDYLANPTKARVPHQQSKSTGMSNFFIHEGLLCLFYIPDHLRRRDTFRDQLVMPKSLRTPNIQRLP